MGLCRSKGSRSTGYQSWRSTKNSADRPRGEYIAIIRQQGLRNSFQIWPILGIGLENEVHIIFRILEENAKYFLQQC